MYRGDQSLSDTRRKRASLLGSSPRGGAGARRLTALLVFAVLSLSSFSLLAAASAYGQGQSASPGFPAHEFTASDRAWDWAALAGEDGYVDVIVSMPFGQEGMRAIDAALEMASEASYRLSGSESLPGTGHSPKAFGHSLNGFSARLDLGTIDALLARDPGLSIYPDITLNATDTDDARQIGADRLWEATDPSGSYVTGLGIVVAVIDTGVDYTHPDLGGDIGAAYKVIGGYDFVNDDSDPMDDNGHGTHVAGIIAADGGILGVAPDARILAYKALGAGGSGSMSDVIFAIDAALDPDGDGLTDDHADIISMSLGGAGSVDDPVCEAVERAVAEGVVVIVAAGNEGPSLGTVATPGVAPSALTVGAVDDDGVLAEFSSRGPTTDMRVKPEISAPGVGILSTVPFSGTSISSPTGYASLSGTSMATPHVSGAAALLLQMHPAWTPAMVKSAIVSNPTALDESLWAAGAGEVWVPGASEETLFSSDPLVSYGLAGSSPKSFSVTNSGMSGTFMLSSSDSFSMTANGTHTDSADTGLSSASPLSVYISSSQSAAVSVTVSMPSTSSAEGYYEGAVSLTSSLGTVSVPFGFVVLSTLNVHVYDISGDEVFDPYGGVWVYDLPDAEYAAGRTGDGNAAPPATFLLPSGEYAVHAIGHQLVYTYSDPYVLSSTVSVGMLQSVDLDLYMSSAHDMVLDLETEDGQPVYVKDYRVYCRYEGSTNISFDLTGSDYSVVGPEVFSIPHSMHLYVSDTEAEVGVSIAGFAYTPAMWSFMSLNWQHWYEYVSGSSTSFMIEASADIQYLLAWEFEGVDSSAPSVLTWDESAAAVFETKYDIPGTISGAWCDWGIHRAIGGDATFYVRRDTDTSLNPFFSGLTRKTVVAGTFAELYFPRSVIGGYVERAFYTADYDHLLHAAVGAGIYLPDRNYLQELTATYEEETLGAGPYYPSLFTENEDDSLVLYHPLLRDQSGARVGGAYVPTMNLYKDGGLVGIYQLSEYLARPDAMRVVDLFGTGTYLARIDYSPTSEVTSNVEIELGFAVPSSDRDPPRITAFEMSQSFVPGESLPVSVEVADAMSSVSVEMSWRAGPADTWKALTLSSSGSTYRSSIPTTVSATSIDLMVTVTDAYSNYISAIMTSASLAEVPVVFELSPQDPTVEYRNASVSVVLEGRLTDAYGAPLDPVAGALIELSSGGEKIAMVLDERIVGTTHTHDGTILFQWVLNPTTLFTGVEQDVQVTAEFDLGVYERSSVSFTLTSVPSYAIAPEISLVSPADGSLVAQGDTIDLDIIDDGPVDVLYSLDGGVYVTVAEPWDIQTSSWSDGLHSLAVTVMDDDGFTVTASFSFDVDAASPELEIVQPLTGSGVPLGFELVVSVYDRHLAGVTYALDSSAAVPLPYPYTVDMTGWPAGMHSVVVQAVDAVGHESVEITMFEIVNSTIVAALSSPGDGSFISSGTPLQLVVYSTGSATCTWSNGGAWTELPEPYAIPTAGWDEGAYGVHVQASDDLGGFVEFSFSITVDDTLPVISLMWPEAGTYLTPDDIVSFQVTDDNLDYAVWSILGISQTATSGTFTVSLSSVDLDGPFSLAVEARDLAGNTAEDSIAFTMDLYDPVVGLLGLATGDSVMSGEDMVLVASDSHLMGISLSVDGGSPVAAYPGMAIGTGALAPGWHSFLITATDMAGRTVSEEFDIYVDATPPDVGFSGPLEFVPGEAMTITASASDDFAVAGGTAHYELEAGGYGSVEMSLSGSELVASIPSELLWDGMDFYVTVVDDAGNSAESAHVSAVEMVSLSGGEWYTSALGLGMIGAGALALVLVAFVVARRRSDGRPERPASEPVQGAREAVEASVAPASAPVTLWPEARGRAVALDKFPAPSASAGVPGSFVFGETVPEPEAMDEDDIDYGELIERELIQGVFGRSAFREAGHGRPEAYAPGPVRQRPRIVPFLKLKRIMDGDDRDDERP
ncbi:MAG: S8 family serine peptidase [Thermoplasmata archaeon]